MDPIATLPNAVLRSGSPVADALLARGVTMFRDACQWVKDLPYGRNSRIDDVMVLFDEGHGTCVTKHGVIARLAGELQLDVHKSLGFYRLTDQIVTGVSDILRPYSLDFVPASHCFLEHGPFRVDLTQGNRTGKNRDVDDFDFVVRVGPESSRDELQQYYSRHFLRYAAMEPRLARLGETVVRELLQKCHRHAACRCSGAADLVTAAGVIP